VLAGMRLGFWEDLLNLPAAQRAEATRAVAVLLCGLEDRADDLVDSLSYAHQSLLGNRLGAGGAASAAVAG